MMAECSKFYLSPLDKMRLSFKCNAFNGAEVNVLTSFNLVIEGHSFTDPTKTLGNYLMTITKASTYENKAVGGSSIAQMAARASSVDDCLLTEASGLKNILVVWVGVNDLRNVTGQVATSYAALKNYVQSRITAGWKVFCFTMTPTNKATDPVVFETERSQWNTLLKTDLDAINNVYVIDTDTATELTNYADTTYFSDNIHLTDGGNIVASNLFRTVLDSVYSNRVESLTLNNPLTTLTLTPTGTGLGIAKISLLCTKPTFLQLSGGAKFYTDAGATLGESDIWVLNPTSGASITRYIKCAALSSLKIDKKITKCTEWLSELNAPSLGGDIGNQTDIYYLSVTGLNTLSGDISLWILLEYLHVLGTNTLSGSILNLTPISTLICEGSNTLSGDISGLEALGTVRILGSATVTYSTVAAITHINSLYIRRGILTSENVNQLLADFWANKDIAKVGNARTIDLFGETGTGAPTGQGLIDKAALQTYRSPNNDPAKNLWTVTTR